MSVIKTLLLQKDNINTWLYAVILLFLIISNNFNSISIIVFIVFNLITFPRGVLLKIVSDKLILLSASIFLLYLISFLLSENKDLAMKVVERNVSFLLLPITIFSSTYNRSKLNLKRIIRIFIYIISILLLISFLIALYKNFTFNLDNNNSFFRFKSWFFTYHYIASNINISAIYLSLYGAFTASFLMLDLLGKENFKLGLSQRYKWVWLFSLVFFLFLLSARTILVSTSIIIYFFIFKHARANKKLTQFVCYSFILFLCISVIVFYNDVLRLRVLSAFQFHDDAKYFAGGLSSRGYQWTAIFNELLKGNLFFGVGIGDIYERYLIAYKSYNLDWAIKNNFNSHSMYLEILFSTGIFGVCLFLFLFIESLKIALKHKDLKYQIFLILFLIAGTTESLFSRQYGIIYFLIFNSLFYFSLKYKER